MTKVGALRGARFALVAGALIVAAGPGPAQDSMGAPQAPASESREREAQTRPPGGDVTVNGRKVPGAEAPRSALCEVLVRDPYYRSVQEAASAFGGLVPYPLASTRMPRNPDYSAPPLVPPGSPLPDLSETRFGLPELDLGAASPSTDLAGSTFLPDPTAADTGSREQAVASCRASYKPGTALSNSPAPFRGMPGSQTIFSGVVGARGGRSTLIRRDETLPMAFALFEQGRYAEALQWFRKAEHRLPDRDGGEEAMLFIGKITLQGLGEQSDPSEAVEWLKKAASARYDPTRDMPVFDPRRPERNTAVGEAAIILGNLYRTGSFGVRQDHEAARKWFERAFDVGHVPAAQALGDMYYQGIGADRDIGRAVSWYRKAARLDLAAAQFALAQILELGEGDVAQHREEALGWYHAAARHDHAGALFALAVLHDRGGGGVPDQQLAIGFYKAAALQGHAGAMAALGTYFYEGEQVPRDHQAARRWFAEAAARRDADGMFNLAAMQIRSEGGPKDLAEALNWLEQAALLDHARAPQAIAAMRSQLGQAGQGASGSPGRPAGQ